MAVVLSPIALFALRAGAFALVAAALAVRRGPSALDKGRESALDALPEGASLGIDAAQGRADAAARLRRVIRLGARGPGIAVEAAALARLRLRRAPPLR